MVGPVAIIVGLLATAGGLAALRYRIESRWPALGEAWSSKRSATSRSQWILIAFAWLVVLGAAFGGFCGWALHSLLACTPGETLEGGAQCGSQTSLRTQEIIAFLGAVPACVALWAAYRNRMKMSICLMIATLAWYLAWVLYIAAHSHS
jgi:hypothetical protein